MKEPTEAQRRWNRENHGKPVRIRIPSVITDDKGTADSIGHREIETTLITDPDRLNEPRPPIAAVWLNHDEHLTTPDRTGDDQ